jgi:circadian clock protein KaiC
VLVNELRARGVTTLYTMETRALVGSGIEMPISGISSVVESLIALRYVEYHARSHRLLSVIKMRDSGFDPALREFVISDGSGISLVGAFEGAESLLNGFARDRRAGGWPSGPEGE